MALFLCPDCNQHIRLKTVCPNCHPRTYSNGLPLALLLGIGCHKTEPAKPEVMALYGAPPMEVIEQLEQDTDDKPDGEQDSEQDDQSAEDVDDNQTDTEDGEQSKPTTGEDSTDGVNNGDEEGSTTDSDENVEEAEPVKPVVKPLYGLPARPDPTIKRP